MEDNSFKPFDPSKVIEEKNKQRDALLSLKVEEKTKNNSEKNDTHNPELISQEDIDNLVNGSQQDKLDTTKNSEEKSETKNYKEEIANIKSKDELMNFLDSIEGIEGLNSADFRKSDYLKELIEYIFNKKNKDRISRLPEADGFRDKVGEIFDMTFGEEKEIKEKENIDAEKAKDSDVESKEDKELQKLILEVEKTRATYAKKDYEVANSIENIKRVLGKVIKIDSKDFRDTEGPYGEYQKALKNLLGYRVNRLKEKNHSIKENTEIDELIKYYNQDEKINLYEAHTNARSEVWEEKFKIPGYLTKFSGKLVNEYRKVSWKKKLAISAALTAAGLGTAFAGSLGIAGAAGAASVVGAAKLVQRGISGVMIGAGATGAMEAAHRKKENKKAEEKGKNIKEELEKSENNAEIYDKLMEKMQAEMSEYQKDLKTEKDKARHRKILGVTIGIVFAKWGAEAMRNVSDTSGFTEALKVAGKYYADGIVGISEKTGLTDAFGSAKDFARSFWAGKTETAMSSVHPATKEILGDHVEKNYLHSSSQAPLEKEVANTGTTTSPENQNVKTGSLDSGKIEIVPGENTEIVSKGGSFTGSVEEHLEKMGFSHDKAKETAYKMYMEYMEHCPDPTGRDYNIIQPGSKIEFGFDENNKLKIINFEDGKKFSISNVNTEKSVSSGKNIESSGDIKNNGSSSMIMNESKEPPRNVVLEESSIKPEDVSSESVDTSTKSVSTETPVKQAEIIENKVSIPRAFKTFNARALEMLKTNEGLSKVDQVKLKIIFEHPEKVRVEFPHNNTVSYEGLYINNEGKTVPFKVNVQPSTGFIHEHDISGDRESFNLAELNSKVDESVKPKISQKIPIESDNEAPSEVPNKSVESSTKSNVENLETDNQAKIESGSITPEDKIRINKEGIKHLEKNLEKINKLISEPLTEKNYNQQIGSKSVTKARRLLYERILKNPESVNVDYSSNGSIAYKGFVESNGRKDFFKILINPNTESLSEKMGITEKDYNIGTPLNEINSVESSASAVQAPQETPSSPKQVETPNQIQNPEIIDEIYKKYGFVESDGPIEKISKIGRKISLNNSKHWENIKDFKFSELKNYSNVLGDNAEIVEKDCVKMLGVRAEYKEGETVKEWLLKIAKIMKNMDSGK